MDKVFKAFKNACWMGNLNRIQHILDTNPTFIDYKIPHNNDSLIMWLCDSSIHTFINIEILQLLLNIKNTHIVAHQNFIGETALMYACMAICVDSVKLLLQTGNAHPEYQNDEGESALILLCEYEEYVFDFDYHIPFITIIKLLLQTGEAHPEYQDCYGESALMFACKISLADVSSLLQTGNAHPEYQNSKGESALMFACKYGMVCTVELLLKTGNAHPEYQNCYGESALMYACKNDVYYDNLETIKLLLKTGNAHPEYVNTIDGKTAYDYGNEDIKKCIRLYINFYLIRKIRLIVKVITAFRNYDKGKPYSCEMFYLMGQDGITPDENLEFNVGDEKRKINSQQLKFMKLGYKESTLQIL